ncbi:MAG: diguanylate cyclase domain-containing protein, partial [Planctomycetota bacterium]
KATLDMVCISEGEKLSKTTVSVGVASFPSCGRTPSSLLRVADAALYDAKRAGRNCLREAAPLEPDMIDDTLRSRALAESQ